MMNENKAARVMHAGSCAALLALLGICGAMGAIYPRTQTVSVPVTFETYDAQTAAASAVETKERLEEKRREAMAILDKVMEEPDAPEESVREALEQKTEIASLMKAEAGIEAALSHMGIEPAAAVCSKDMAAIIVPEEIALSEQSRMQILDLASGFCGLPASSVKIILAKK